MIKHLKLKSNFSRNVLTLMTGTTIAQAIPIGIMPIITRLYTPEDFGVFALYSAVVAVISVFATARYELAIMMPIENEQAKDLVWLSIFIAAFTAIIFTALILLFGKDISKLLGRAEIEFWLYFVPISVFLTGIFQALNYWNTRNKYFINIAKSKIVQSTTLASTQVLVGMSKHISTGLVAGSLAGQAATTLYLANKIKKDKTFNRFSIKGSMKVAKEYKKFPLISTWGALFDRLALQMPIFMLTKLFSASATGQFSLTFRILNLPMSLIGTAVSQVLFQRVTEMHNQHPAKLKAYIVKLFFLLWLPMLPMMAILSIWGEALFEIVFGQAWALAGTLAATLSIAAAVRFAVSPLSMVLAMDHNLKLGTTWQALYLVTLTITLLWGSQFELQTFVSIFVVHELVLYLIYFAFILKGSEHF